MNKGDTINWNGSEWRVGARRTNGMVCLARTHDKHPPFQCEGDSVWLPAQRLSR